MIDVDLVGTWRTVRATLPAVSERRGYYLIVSSLAAVAHAPFNAAYNAAKAGVVALAKTMRMELAPQGIAVGIADVTYADTETARRAVEDPRMHEVLVRDARRRPYAPRLAEIGRHPAEELPPMSSYVIDSKI